MTSEEWLDKSIKLLKELSRNCLHMRHLAIKMNENPMHIETEYGFMIEEQKEIIKEIADFYDDRFSNA